MDDNFNPIPELMSIKFFLQVDNFAVKQTFADFVPLANVNERFGVHERNERFIVHGCNERFAVHERNERFTVHEHINDFSCISETCHIAYMRQNNNSFFCRNPVHFIKPLFALIRDISMF